MTRPAATLEWVRTSLQAQEGVILYQGTGKPFKGRRDLSPAQAAWALEYGVVDGTVHPRNADAPLTLDNLIQWDYRKTDFFWWYQPRQELPRQPLQRVRVEPVRMMEEEVFVWITPPPPTSLQRDMTPYQASVERRMAYFAQQTAIRPCQVWLIPLQELVKLKGRRTLARLPKATTAMAQAMAEQRHRGDWPLHPYHLAP